MDRASVEEMLLDITDADELALSRVLVLLGSNHPLVNDLEQYIIGFSVLGRMTAERQALMETLDLQKKEAWASSFRVAKANKESDRAAAAQADIDTADIERMVIQAKRGYTSLRNTRDTVQEAINAIKYLNRFGG